MKTKKIEIQTIKPENEALILIKPNKDEIKTKIKIKTKTKDTRNSKL